MGTMTLRTDLTALLAEAGIADVDIDKALAVEHVRSSAYHKVIAVVAASQCRDNDRTVVATVLRDPVELVSKTVVVKLVDNVARKMNDPIEFQQWAARLVPEIDHLTAVQHRAFLHRRIHDWTIYLTIMAGRTPTTAEMASITHWMQRLIATESTSLRVLAILAETGCTRKIRNIARNHADGRRRTPGTS
jgi:hypothetical protein